MTSFPQGFHVDMLNRVAEIITGEDAFYAGLDLFFHARPDSLHEIFSG